MMLFSVISQVTTNIIIMVPIIVSSLLVLSFITHKLVTRIHAICILVVNVTAMRNIEKLKHK